jgi:hypothetical protein
VAAAKRDLTDEWASDAFEAYRWSEVGEVSGKFEVYAQFSRVGGDVGLC